MAIPATPEAHRKRKEDVRRKFERESGKTGGNGQFGENGESFKRGKVDWEAKFRSMGLDFETEWRNALKENLVLMRNGEQEMKKVDELTERKPRRGLHHNATIVG